MRQAEPGAQVHFCRASPLPWLRRRCQLRTSCALARRSHGRSPAQQRPRNRPQKPRGFYDGTDKHDDHDLREPVSVGVAGGFGTLLRPGRRRADSSLSAFSTARSIPRSSNPHAATTGAQSRTKRPPAVAVGLRPVIARATSASRKRRKSRAGFFLGRPPRLSRSSSNQVLIGWLILSMAYLSSAGPSLSPIACR